MEQEIKNLTENMESIKSINNKDFEILKYLIQKTQLRLSNCLATPYFNKKELERIVHHCSFSNNEIDKSIMDTLAPLLG